MFSTLSQKLCESKWKAFIFQNDKECKKVKKTEEDLLPGSLISDAFYVEIRETLGEIAQASLTMFSPTYVAKRLQYKTIEVFLIEAFLAATKINVRQIAEQVS